VDDTEWASEALNLLTSGMKKVKHVITPSVSCELCPRTGELRLDVDSTRNFDERGVLVEAYICV
jgi:hypothetical protein